MPSGTWIKYEIVKPIAVATGPETVCLLQGSYIGLPVDGEDELFDLFRMGADGEPEGECQGRMGGTIVDRNNAGG